jgi:hypothetical protein
VGGKGRAKLARDRPAAPPRKLGQRVTHLWRDAGTDENGDRAFHCYGT